MKTTGSVFSKISSNKYMVSLPRNSESEFALIKPNFHQWKELYPRISPKICFIQTTEEERSVSPLSPSHHCRQRKFPVQCSAVVWQWSAPLVFLSLHSVPCSSTTKDGSCIVSFVQLLLCSILMVLLAARWEKCVKKWKVPALSLELVPVLIQTVQFKQ